MSNQGDPGSRRLPSTKGDQAYHARYSHAGSRKLQLLLCLSRLMDDADSGKDEEVATDHPPPRRHILDMNNKILKSMLDICPQPRIISLLTWTRAIPRFSEPPVYSNPIFSRGSEALAIT